MVALVKYMAVSTLAASVVVYHAFATRQHFFPATLYLSSSKVAAATIGNMAFASALLVHKLVIKVFLGALRDSEREMIQERLSSAVMESLLALTIFREEFSAFFVVMFASLVFIKVLHWLVQDRVDYAEVTPSISLLQHLRITSFLAFLLILDSSLLQYTVLASISSNGQSVMLLFAFEYVLQASNVIRYGLKYALSMIDLAWEGRWEHKGTFVFYLELITDLLHLSVYVVFFIIVFMHYGLPLHLMRDLYSTFNNFRNRIQQFLRFRQVTARLDRFPDASAEDLERCAGVCIICREDMAMGASNKRLSCGHVFHLHCLRSWLGQQQICPTCRASVFRPPPLAIAAAAPVAPAAAVNDAAGVALGEAAVMPEEAAAADNAGLAAPAGPARGGWPAQPAAAVAPAAAEAAVPAPLRRLEDDSDDSFAADEEVQAELALMRAERAERETRPHSYRAAILEAAGRMHRASAGGAASGSGASAGGAARPRTRPARDPTGNVASELQTLMDMLGSANENVQTPAWAHHASNPAARQPRGSSVLWVLRPTNTAAPNLLHCVTPEQQAAAAASAAVAAVFGIPVTSVTSTVVPQAAASSVSMPAPLLSTTPPPTPQTLGAATSASTSSPTPSVTNLLASLVATQGVMALQLQQLAALVAASEASSAAAVAASAAAAAAVLHAAVTEAANKAAAAATAQPAEAQDVAPAPSPVSAEPILPNVIPAAHSTALLNPAPTQRIDDAAQAHAALRIAESVAMTANSPPIPPAVVDHDATMRSFLHHIQSSTHASIQQLIDPLPASSSSSSPAAAAVQASQLPPRTSTGAPPLSPDSSSAASVLRQPSASSQGTSSSDAASPAPVDDADETQRELRRRRLQKFDLDRSRS